jgi:hypothetical protein
MCRAGSITIVAREIAKYKVDLVGVQEVREDRQLYISLYKWD